MSKYHAYTDDVLISRLRSEEEWAFDEIYRRYWKRLYLAAFKRIGISEICEELVQDIFTSLWVNCKTVSIHNLSAYLFTATRYKVINHIHKEMVRKAARQEDDLVEADNSTEEEVLLDDLNRALENEVRKLPVRCQMVYKLSHENNLSIKQVAAEMGISEKTVENQLSKALKVLRLNLRHFTYLWVLLLFS